MNSEQSALLMQIVAGLSQVLILWGILWLTLRVLCSGLVAIWLTNGLILTGIIAALITHLGFELNLYDRLDSRGVLITGIMALNLVVVPLFYWLDKRKARLQSVIRIPETVLHGLSFMGGAGSALIAQKRFHHKTAKQGFRRKTWGALILNGALFYGLLFI
ncbi:DUF1294 domain-containing protein [Amphritea atlantica]|uniref:DUF1294 domain-containing protein n=1 Tax=Amphritea atlantica TaxID=355243 RepID=A0ABY5GZ58_9GAMM|nr:DUF1294 domain-containing protein [Amphritea atlantica]